jgi:hypothetical protein
MGYSEDDDKQLLIGFVLFLANKGWITEPHAKLMWLVDQYMELREEQREWGK